MSKSKKNKNKSQSDLPMNAMKEVPTPKGNAQQIVALVKESGTVSGYQLADGRILSREEGVQLARKGGISGVGIATNQGTEYLKSLPDATESNNLSNLPTVDQ